MLIKDIYAEKKLCNAERVIEIESISSQEEQSDDSREHTNEKHAKIEEQKTLENPIKTKKCNSIFLNLCSVLECNDEDDSTRFDHMVNIAVTDGKKDVFHAKDAVRFDYVTHNEESITQQDLY